jgi:aspartokinase/homoserine dehydrogenase 1
LFNNFSAKDAFSEILKEAIDSGFTEPDQRRFMWERCGRKLLILARELDLQNEFDEIEIQI